MTLTSPELREQVALACRVLAATGLVENVLGHVSVRTSQSSLLVRGRGPNERGLAHTTVDDVHEVPFDGAAREGDWAPPQELPLHVEPMRRQPEVTAVVHAHPPAVVAATVARLPWRPVVGAYDIPAARMAAEGIPEWPRSVLVRRADLAHQLLDHMGQRPVCVLRGHGLLSVAGGDPMTAIAAAVVQAVAVDSLARMMLAAASAGSGLESIPEEDLAELPDLGAGFNVSMMWRHLLTRLP
ncbi:class II aldolase/adducin family protein [Saccharopolyspora sp. K220]|uniref:class II aldolase/adducin family protein n=1 Tax=Saccharopolyspora soli TaxID=2926618 RepID=UPI001F5AA82F|nr:class II aldolase/adducin family protein [Saccharopolyspora soli]MCI2421003.1 class II aldolase/adducin family protein [Saccharopolyspora soli]